MFHSASGSGLPVNWQINVAVSPADTVLDLALTVKSGAHSADINEQ